MRGGLIVALLLYVAAVFVAFGWFTPEVTDRAIGLIAAGLAVQLLAGIPVPPRAG